MDMESAEGKKKSPDNQALSEIIFYHILKNVFSHLNSGDLCRAARVSKLWNETARREFSRRGAEIFVLPFPREGNDSDSDSNSDHEEDDPCTTKRCERIKHTYTVLRGRPKAAILFVDGTSVGYGDPVFDTYNEYDDDFYPTATLIVVETLDITVNGNRGIEKGKVPGLLLPVAQSLEYTFVHRDINDFEESRADDVDLPRQIVENLLSTTQEYVCIIIFLATGWYDYSLGGFWSNVLSNVTKRCEPGKFTFWGGRVESLANSGCDESFPPVIHAVSLSGPTQRSWSIVLDCKLPTSETEKQLLTFKSNVSLKSTSVAFLFVPTSKENTREERSSKTKVFKSIFPNVETLCIFNDEKYPLYGVSSTSSIGDQKIRHMDSIACLIFT